MAGQVIYKCGLREKKFDPRTLRLASFMEEEELPDPPDNCSWDLPDIATPMYANADVGTCAIAGPGHMIGVWTRQAWGQEALFTDQQILDQYSEISGYNQETGAGDEGCAMLDVMKVWQKTGLMGHKCLGYASVNHQQTKHMRLSLNWFGGLAWGLRLPQTIVTQGFPSVWDVVDSELLGESEPGSFGGHAVSVVEYMEDGNWTGVSWGTKVTITAAFIAAYLDECFAVLSPDWIMPTFVSPGGLDTRGLLHSMGLIADR